jgi:hypothetical protein
LAEYKAKQASEVHKVYTTEALRLIENHLAYIQSSAGMQTGMLKKRYYDLMHENADQTPQKPPEEKEKEIRSKFVNAFKGKDT